MEKEIEQLSALAHPHRLAIFRLLMRRYPDQLPAGEIGAVLGLKPSTLSAYLSALSGAGLIAQERQGTSLRYAVAQAQAQALMGFLFHDCCRARTDICAPDRPTSRIRNVLFLCSHNSARSLMAEAILRDLAGDRFEVFSAGTDTRSEPNPQALALLQERGHDISCLWSKPAGVFRAGDAPQMDFVFSVCDLAANEDLVAWPGQPVQGHWAVPDPVLAATPESFEQSYATLRCRIAAFTDLPAAMPRAALQRAVDDIALLHPEPL